MPRQWVNRPLQKPANIRRVSRPTSYFWPGLPLVGFFFEYDEKPLREWLLTAYKDAWDGKKPVIN